MSNIVIQRLKCHGLLIDERLDWQEHINSCKNKLTSAIYTVNRVSTLPVSALKTTYCTLGYPYLTYGTILWGSTYKSYFTILFIVQKIIVRSVLKRNYMEHYHALFYILRLITIV